MLAKEAISPELTVPQYTSYPAAPHFGPAVDKRTYASWLDDLSRSDDQEIEALPPFVASGYVHVDNLHIAVTESGQSYLRLIVAALNNYIPNFRARHSIAV